MERPRIVTREDVKQKDRMHRARLTGLGEGNQQVVDVGCLALARWL